MESSWLTGREVVARWGIKDFEILQYVKEGLQPYHKGRKGMEPQLPPEVVDIKSEIKIISDQMNVWEKMFDGFSGTPIHIEEWRNLTSKGTIEEHPGATYYSDGSTDWIRDSYETQKTSLGLYEKELAKYPDHQTWRRYDDFEDKYNLDSVTLLLLISYFKREDIEDREATSNTNHPIRIKVISTKRLEQEDKEKAIEIAKAHIAECLTKGETPILADGIDRALDLHKRKYKSKTIRNWIKAHYPPDSRTPGRKKGWKTRQEKAKKRNTIRDLSRKITISIFF